MTDTHFHKEGCGACLSVKGREIMFWGIHPWQAAECGDEEIATVKTRLAEDPSAGVGEIGLDRLRTRTVTDVQKTVFSKQLAIAAELGRPVTLHGARCWGEVVAACQTQAASIPAFLFHGFSRSPGLLPDIIAMNGFLSVGPTLLNDHAANYRKLAESIPTDRLLVETDTEDSPERLPLLRQVVGKLAEIRGISVDELENLTDSNAERFLGNPIAGCVL